MNEKSDEGHFDLRVCVHCNIVTCIIGMSYKMATLSNHGSFNLLANHLRILCVSRVFTEFITILSPNDVVVAHC